MVDLDRRVTRRGGDQAAPQALLDDLYATRSQTTCPHGRPVLFRLTTEEIERAFRRR